MKKILLFILTFYQTIISPLLHQALGTKTTCRNNPTCSEYAKEVISRYGVIKGLLLSGKRIVNCQPLFNL